MDPLKITQRYISQLSEEFESESETENTTNKAQSITNIGIAQNSDVFERNNVSEGFFGILQHTPGETSANPFPVASDSTIDASNLFNFVAVSQPAQQESGLGKTAEEASENGIRKAYKKNTNKEYGPDPGRATESESKSYGSDVGMPENLSSLGGGSGETIGELKGSWNLWEIGKVDERTEGELGGAYVKGSTVILGVSGEAYYDIDPDFDDGTLNLGLGAKGALEIVGAHYEAGFDTPDLVIGDNKVDLNGKTNADASVGVKGNINGNFSIGKENKLGLGASGFDGASASISGEIGAGEIADVNGSLTGWTGVGAKAEFEVGFKDGKFNFDWGFGLALGIGLEWDLGFSIDFGETIDTVLDGLREIGLEDPADWIENTGGDAIEAAGDIAKWLGISAEDIGDWMANAAEDGVDAVGNFVEDVGDTAGGVIEDVGDFIGDLW
jgi:hypothetical protein